MRDQRQRTLTLLMSMLRPPIVPQTWANYSYDILDTNASGVTTLVLMRASRLKTGAPSGSQTSRLLKRRSKHQTHGHLGPVASVGNRPRRRREKACLWKNGGFGFKARARRK